MDNCIMKIEFDYHGKLKTIELEDTDLCNSILSGIRVMKNEPKVWFPNDEIDNNIRKYISEKIKNESYYTKGIHPCHMVVRVNDIPYHIIHDYYSEEEKNKIINDILKEYQ